MIGVLAIIGMSLSVAVSRLGIKYLYNGNAEFGVV